MRYPATAKVAAALVAVATAFGAVACGSDDEGSGGSGGGNAASGGSKVNMAIVLPCPTSDPWCKQGFDAAKQLEREGKVNLKVTTGAPQDTAGAARVLSQYAQSGSKLVIAHSTYQDAANDAASKFADANFATVGSETKKNLALYEEPIYEAAYLAGMLAGGITKTDVIGGTAGQDVPLCHAELEAFEAGAKKTNSSVKMLSTYIGDWNDVAKGQRAAQAQIDQKADVIIACGGAPANGMAQAIKTNDVSGFGYVGDMNAQAPENMVGSIVYNLYPYFSKMVDDVKAGSFQPGKTYNFGLADGGVELKLNDAYSAAEIPSDVMSEMEKVQADIKSGKFKVPYEPGT